jgi:hypothetical protein
LAIALIRTVLDATFNIQAIAAPNVLLDGFCGCRPECKAMPVRPFLKLSIHLIATIRRQ